MSTKKIKAALDRFGMESRSSLTDLMVAEALTELAALRMAAKTFHGENTPNVLPRDEADAAWAIIQAIGAEYTPLEEP